jgi:hypothetical protein
MNKRRWRRNILDPEINNNSERLWQEATVG